MPKKKEYIAKSHNVTTSQPSDVKFFNFAPFDRKS